MQTVGIDVEAAECALVVVAAQVPPLVAIGRPLVASRDGSAVVLVTDVGTWWVRPGVVERLAVLPDGRHEVTRWSGGVELSRSIS